MHFCLLALVTQNKHRRMDHLEEDKKIVVGEREIKKRKRSAETNDQKVCG